MSMEIKSQMVTEDWMALGNMVIILMISIGFG